MNDQEIEGSGPTIGVAHPGRGCGTPGPVLSELLRLQEESLQPLKELLRLREESLRPLGEMLKQRERALRRSLPPHGCVDAAAPAGPPSEWDVRY